MGRESEAGWLRQASPTRRQVSRDWRQEPHGEERFGAEAAAPAKGSLRVSCAAGKTCSNVDASVTDETLRTPLLLLLLRPFRFPQSQKHRGPLGPGCRRWGLSCLWA